MNIVKCPSEHCNYNLDCNNCKKTLNWYDNIPILSWIIINGKCRFCNWPIPLSYPLVELTLGLIFALNCQALSYTKEETFTKLIGISIFSTICFIASLIDLDLMIIHYIYHVIYMTHYIMPITILLYHIVSAEKFRLYNIGKTFFLSYRIGRKFSLYRIGIV